MINHGLFLWDLLCLVLFVSVPLDALLSYFSIGIF